MKRNQWSWDMGCNLGDPTYPKQFLLNLKTMYVTYIQAPTRTSPHIMSKVVTYDNLEQKHKLYAAAITSVSEPNSYIEASKHTCWQQAMDAGIKSLQDNNTWILTTLPPGKTPIGCIK